MMIIKEAKGVTSIYSLFETDVERIISTVQNANYYIVDRDMEDFDKTDRACAICVEIGVKLINALTFGLSTEIYEKSLQALYFLSKYIDFSPDIRPNDYDTISGIIATATVCRYFNIKTK